MLKSAAHCGRYGCYGPDLGRSYDRTTKARPLVQGPTAPVSGRGGRGSSSSFDDKHGLVVDQGLVAALSEALILLYRVIQQCIADLSGRLSVVFAQDLFKQLARLFVAAVVNSIGIENKNISRTHQGDLGDIGRVELSWP